MANKVHLSKNAQMNIIKLRNIIKDLPPICNEYFRGIEPSTSILTRVNYAYDLRLFFNYLTSNIDEFKEKTPKDLTIEDFNKIEAVHIEMFLEHVTYYQSNKDEKLLENHEAGKARKLSAIRSCFSHFYKKGYLNKNVTELVDAPKMHEKPIIRLDVDEIARLLDAIENGEGLTKTQKKYHNYTRQRDLAMITLFLGTGIRISECVGLNISDFNFRDNSFKITRKGGNEEILYFSEEVRKELIKYLEERKKVNVLPGYEDAFFLSMQRKRISNRAVQNLVKKYAHIISPLKKITPHKLRSTYGTNLYRQTGDIYLVADVLGHKDVNTTRKHYAAISEDKRRKAARVIKLRDD